MDSPWPADLFLNEAHSDVEFRIEAELSSKQLVFPAHSLVLKHASPVFRAMLEEDMFEEGKTGVVKLRIPGYDVDALAFLRYIYTKDLCCTDLDNFLALLQAGHLYQINSLVEACIKKIKEKMTICSACKIVDLMKCFDEYDIHQDCLTLIMRSAFFVFQKNLHLLFSEDSMCAVLRSHTLNVIDEDQVVEAVWSWGKARIFTERESVMEKLPEVTQKLLDHVRWALVKNTNKNASWYEFTEAKKKQQNKKTVLERMCYLKISIIPFSRCCSIYDRTKTICNEDYPANGQCQIAVFSTNRDIMLSGFQIRVGTTKWLFEEQLHFHVLLNKQNTKEMVFPTFTFLSQNHVKWFYVTFEFFKPVLIEGLRVNTMTIEDSENPPALKVMARHVLKKSLIHGAVNFSFNGDVFAVHKLFYFS